MIVKLGDICTFQSGGTPSKGTEEFFNGTIPWITTTALNGGKIDETQAVDWITEKAIEKSAAKLVPAFSIMVGTRVGVGKVAVNAVQMSTSQDIISLLNIDENRWSKDYLCKYIQGKNTFLNYQARGATIKGIKIDVLANLELEEIPLEEQVRISETIDKVKEILDARKRELLELDKLIKARFAELFGDTKSNDKGWNTLPLFKILEKGSSVSYGIVQTGDNVEDGVPVFRPIDIAGGHLPHINELKRTKKEISDKYKRTLLNGYELLITVRGSVGETFQVNDEYKGCNVGRNIVPLRFNTDIVLYKYMEQYFAQSGTKDILVTMTKGIALQGLNMSEFREIAVIVPPIDLQKKFVEFANIIDKSKAVVQKSLDETQVLFDSLMQKYFG